MFLNVDGLDTRELRKLELMFGKRLSAFQNPYYLICVEEILAALENEMEEEDLERFKRDPLYGTYISEMAQELYAKADYQWDELYEKAVYIINAL